MNNNNKNNNNKNGKSAQQQLQRRARSNNNNRRRRKYSRDRPPTVDSALLRFVGRQKESLGGANVDPVAGLEEQDQPPTTMSTQQQQQQEQKNVDRSSNTTKSLDTTTLSGGTDTAVNGMSGGFVEEKDETDVMSTPNEKTDEDISSSEPTVTSTWWGQYNTHRVETVLLSRDETLDRVAVHKAGVRVQAQVLARTVRRRIRTFLKERDQTWQASSVTIGAVGDMISPGSMGTGHSLDDSVDVMMNHGLTAKDVTDILQHSPGIVLMRPRGSANGGECLDDTLRRVFSLLCETLSLRRYDARKIIRASPSLLTMRGSKSAESVVDLLSQLGISHNAVARDKASLTDFLMRSPASIFRLVAFLSGDAIRMPVSKIGPLLRRRLSRELLDAVAPVPQQLSGTNEVTSTLSSNSTDDSASYVVEDHELDPWIASALWGRQSQIRRDRIDDIYRRMTKTALTLRNEVGTADLSKVVAAYPSVLLLDAQNQILPNAAYIMDSLGICKGDLSRVLQLYPALLGLPIERMEAMATALQSLGISSSELTSIFRSFPALLTLDVKENVIPVVRFLRAIGVIDVGRFLTRIPPILGYSVETELIPKWRLLQSFSSDPRFEVTKFPAYFSYPMERVIKARYEYIRDVKKFPTQLISVEKVVSYGDHDFAVHILKEEDEGQAFERFQEQRRQERHPKKKAKRRNTKNPKPKTQQVNQGPAQS